MFTESNTVERMILNAVATLGGRQAPGVQEDASPYRGESLGDELRPAHWTYVLSTEVPRQPSDVMVEPWVREALIRLNPDIAAQPDRADEVIYNLRACILSVQADGLVRANENFMAWLRGEKTMPFGITASMCRCTWWTLPSPPTIGSPSPTSGPFRRARWRSGLTWCS